MKISFTVKRIAALKLPTEGKRIYVYDEVTPGLCLMLTSKGPQSFYCYRWINAAPQRYRLAGFAEVTIEQVRKLASAALVKIAGGADLNKQRQAERAKAADVPTLETLFLDYLETYAKLHKREISWREDQRLFEKNVGNLKSKPLAEVTDEVIAKLHRTIGTDKGRYTANRTMAMLSTAFRQCGKHYGLPKMWSPTVGVERFKESPRDRILSEEELVRFWKALEAEENETLRDFFKMSLMTGARKGNILAMKWEDVSLQRAEWKIPGTVTKNGQPLKIPLVPGAMEILQRRPDKTPYVFPSIRITPEQIEQVRTMAKAGDSTRSIARNLGVSQSAVMRALKPDFDTSSSHLAEPKFAWERLLKRAGIKERTTIHDLRRTVISAMIRAGASIATVAAAAGHKTTATTLRHYSIAGGDEVRKAFGAGVAALLGTPATVEEVKHGA